MLSRKVPVFAAALGLCLAVGCSNQKAVESDAVAAKVAPDAAAEPVKAPEPPAAVAITTATLGEVAPNFTLTDTDGNEVSLASFRGKTVVLEWFNPGCPFVVYAHGEGGPLVNQPKTHTDKGVVWLAINSGGEGNQGFGLPLNQQMRGEWGMSYPVLLDPTGDVGRMYGAKTTPHMYIVNDQGILVYQGALDNAPRGDVQGEAAINYVDAALAELAAGGKVSMDNTKPYGCSVKYAG